MTMTFEEKQDHMLAAIRAFWLRRGYGPSIRDLIALTGYSSTSAVSYAVKRLASRGLVYFSPDVARSIQPVELRCPTCGSPRPEEVHGAFAKA